MFTKAPEFWYRGGLQAKLLKPASFLYLAGHRAHQYFASANTVNIPVICVGGVVAGGSGKTPVVHALLKIVLEHGLAENPFILTRGYGGCLDGPVQVNTEIHTYKDVGDEALLHALHAPTIVSKNRYDGAALAERSGADLIIMDDGLQNTQLKKNASILVVDGPTGFGNGQVIPAGPLREPVAEALRKCQGAVIIGDGNFDLSPLDTFRASLAPAADMDKSLFYLGFAGIGRPDKFKRTLLSGGLRLTDFKAFPDHHPYTVRDLEELLVTTGSSALITTEKDYVRIPKDYRKDVRVFPVRLEFEEPQVITDLLKTIVSTR